MEMQEAINSSLMHKDIVNMVDKFCSDYGFNKSEYKEGVVNPGAKSVESLVSKIKRRVEKDHVETLQMAEDIYDAVRCSVIVDNYEEAYKLIKEMQKAIPNLQGDVSENDTGYKGIHLSLSIGTYKAEMQISTRDAWYVKQAGESVYAKWRDFNLKKVLDQYEHASDAEREAIVEKLQKDISLQNIHNKACKNMFEYLYAHSDFFDYKEKIDAVLNVGQKMGLKVDKMDDKFYENLAESDVVDEKHATELATEFHNNAIEYQNRLISVAQSSLKYVKNATETPPLTTEEKIFRFSKQALSEYYNNQISQEYPYVKVEDYIRLVNYTVNASSLEVVEKMKGKEFNKENVLEVLKTTISESNRNVQGLLAKIGNSLQIESKRDKIIQNHGGKR